MTADNDQRQVLVRDGGWHAATIDGGPTTKAPTMMIEGGWKDGDGEINFKIWCDECILYYREKHII